MRKQLLKVLGLLLVFNAFFLTTANSSSQELREELITWKCTVPLTVYAEVQIPARDNEKKELSQLLKEEKIAIGRDPQNARRIQSSYNTKYGKWAEKCSNSWFTEANFKAYVGKTTGDQGFDGFYIVNYSPVQHFVVINEVKFNKARLTKDKCSNPVKCRCGQMSRNWIENNADKLTNKGIQYKQEIQQAIQQGNYSRSLINVDIEGNLYLFKLMDQYCLGTRTCQQLQYKENGYFEVVKNALASVVPLSNS
ncbi:MAG: hypothetical protein K0M45_08860 [Candidatus Paracaedibacteraceae bacterium]|nr:hypothetical protein [Candidatus Paracaedibacteraceae bacterium]